MKVVVPATKLAYETLAALEVTGWDYDIVDVSGSDDSYYEMLTGLWAAGEGFIIVEHDVVVRPDTFDELVGCANDWCRFAVPYMNGAYPGLACVKFTTALVRRNPDAMVRVGELSDATHPAKHWCRLDSWLQHHVLTRNAEGQCLHEPPLGHVRNYDGPPQPSHGCI